MKKFVLTLDLKDDPELIRKYEEYHENVWPEVKDCLTESGIINLEIYRFNTRMCMILETTDNFTFEGKEKIDKANQVVQKWEKLMWEFQSPVPGSRPGEKWVEMKRIY